MNKFLLFSSVLMASLFGTGAYSQNLRMVSQGGQLAAEADAKVRENTATFEGHEVGSNFHDLTIGAWNGVPETTKRASDHEETTQTGQWFWSKSTSEIKFKQWNFSRTVHNPDDGHSLEFSHFQKIKLPASTASPSVNYSGEGWAASGGHHYRTLTPSNPDTWTTQEVAANFKLTGDGRVLTADTTLVRGDYTSAFLKATWGDNYIIARFDEEEDAWEITYYCKFIPNGSVFSDTTWTSSHVLDTDVTVYQTVTSSSYVVSHVEVSDAPTLLSYQLAAGGNQNIVDQTAASHLGSGGGAGATQVTSTGKVEIILSANIKDDT